MKYHSTTAGRCQGTLTKKALVAQTILEYDGSDVMVERQLRKVSDALVPRTRPNIASGHMTRKHYYNVNS